MLLVIKFVYPAISNALTSQSCESEVLFVGVVHFVACIREGLPLLQSSVSAAAFDFLNHWCSILTIIYIYHLLYPS